MRLCTFSTGSIQMRLGLVSQDTITDVAKAAGAVGEGTDFGTNVQALLNSPEALARLHSIESTLVAADPESTYRPDDVQLLPPLPAPGKILCVAANYKAHIEETGVITYVEKHAANPWFFQKPNTALLGHKGKIQVPFFSEKVDWELELAVVIGRRGRYISREEALDHVAGYTVMNDISAREVLVSEHRQQRDRDKFHDWLHGKTFDTFCPMGPCFVTADEVADPQDLNLRLSLNGELMQDSNTALMIFPIAELIEYASIFTTLEVGDIICTGTPSGVGKSRGRFLRSGDQIVAEIEGIGSLHNSVIHERETLDSAVQAGAAKISGKLLHRSLVPADR